MTVTLTWQTIITAGALVAAIIAIASTFARSVRWLDRQRQQDRELAAIKDEQTLMTYGLLACLKGLKEQGCDGPVTDAIDRIEKHLNKKAHE
jgi:hypothetical protein